MEQLRRVVQRLALAATLVSPLAGCLDGDTADPGMTEVPQSAMTGPEGTIEHVLVPARATWQYHDEGVDLGTSWRITSSSSTWASGPGPLGYGEPYVATVVSYGTSATNKHPTTYFRRGFDAVDPSRIRKLYLRAMFDDGFVFYLNGAEGGRAYMPGGTIAYGTFSSGHETGNNYMTFDISSQIPNLDAGANTLAVEVHQQTASSSDLTMDFALIAFIDEEPELPVHEPTPRGIPTGSSWMYWDGGGDLGTAWRAPGYDATGWSAGAAPLGFGESYLATRTTSGPITTYFRHQFTSNGDATGLQLHARFDDGFVAYLNGTEIHRSSMPSGTITANTLALNHEAAGLEGPFLLTGVASLIVEGVNTLAIEVHQASPTSSDLVWDAKLVEETAWQPQQSGTTETLNDIDSHDERLVWAIGDGGTLLRTVDSGKTWTPQPTGTTADLHAIALQYGELGEPEDGWIVGDDGVILVTFDGGETWIDRSLAVPADLRDVFFVGDRGWAVAQGDTDDVTADLYVTTDGGFTWQAQPTGIPGGSFTAVLFIDDQIGWIAGTSSETAGGAIYHTTDGGLTWTLQWSFENHGKWPVELIYQWDGSIWMVGQYSLSGHGELKLVSRDGGATWAEAPHATEHGIYDLTFTDDERAVAVGLHGAIITTDDGGLTWTERRVADFGAHATLLGVEFSDPPRRGWAVGTGGTILVTTSGGIERGWVERDSGAKNLQDVWFTSDARGWVVGWDNVWGQANVETRDGGETWDPIWADSSRTEIEFLADDQHGWVAGRTAMFATSDGGETWIEHPLGPPLLGEFIADFSFVSPTTGWLAVDDYDPDSPSDMYKTTDGGATWTATPTGIPAGGRWAGVHFVDEHTGWLIGEAYQAAVGASIWKTVDGGATWTLQLSTSELDAIYSYALTSLHAIDANTIWVVGAGSPTERELKLVSRDGGATWQEAPPADESPLAEIYFSDATHGWAVGGYGSIVATGDGGLTWQTQVATRRFVWPIMIGVHFSDRYNGWAIGTQGALLETSTGGY
jgi:photosystem II stability/assembly factor-like uncharacterized protein